MNQGLPLVLLNPKSKKVGTTRLPSVSLGVCKPPETGLLPLLRIWACHFEFEILTF